MTMTMTNNERGTLLHAMAFGETMSKAEIREAIEWLVKDARYLARFARIYRARGRGANGWLADRTRANAAHSMKLARQYKAQLAD